MSKGKKFFIVLVLIVLAVLAWFLYSRHAPPSVSSGQPNTSTNSSVKNYKSEKYGFSFPYPGQYEAVVTSPEVITIGKRSFGSFDPLISITLIQSSPEIELQSFEEFVLDESRVVCSTDTADSTTFCTRIDDVVKIAPFSSDSGIQGQRFYLRGEEKDKKSGDTESIRRGPFYTFNSSGNTPNKMSFIMIGNPVSKSPEEANLDLIESVATGLTIKAIP